LHLLDGRISSPRLDLLSVHLLLALQRIDANCIILPRSPDRSTEISLERLSHPGSICLQPLVPDSLARHPTDFIHTLVDPLGGLFEREIVFDGEEVDFARDEEFEEAAVEGGVVAFALASAGFVLDPFVPARGGSTWREEGSGGLTSLRSGEPPVRESATVRHTSATTHTHDLLLSVPRSDGGLGRHVDGKRRTSERAKIQRRIPARTINLESPTAPVRPGKAFPRRRHIYASR
jgi:hypothetical protein